MSLAVELGRRLLFSLASTWPKEKWIWMHGGGRNSVGKRGSVKMRQAECVDLQSEGFQQSLKRASEMVTPCLYRNLVVELYAEAFGRSRSRAAKGKVSSLGGKVSSPEQPKRY